ncbi:MAG: DUF5908 family protein [Microscillaceae bacterium]|nr:DUF5908 family protein [Microscillaceae bacterium]
MAIEIKEIIVKVTVDSQPKHSKQDLKIINTLIYQTKKEIIEECKEYIRKLREDKFER